MMHVNNRINLDVILVHSLPYYDSCLKLPSWFGFLERQTAQRQRKNKEKTDHRLLRESSQEEIQE
jgi:hypothetical protein